MVDRITEPSKVGRATEDWVVREGKSKLQDATRKKRREQERESEREERPRSNQARETNVEETPEREGLHKACTRRRRRLRIARSLEKSANSKKT